MSKVSVRIELRFSIIDRGLRCDRAAAVSERGAERPNGKYMGGRFLAPSAATTTKGQYGKTERKIQCPDWQTGEVSLPTSKYIYRG